MSKRNIILDLLKGIAIMGVILYHLGVSSFGYLGVDLFFVISGYLISLGLIRRFNENNFSYWNFINKRLARLWPGLILISAIAFGIGWFVMLPMHFKANCEAVIGSLTFTNNIIQYITCGDYWTSMNDFKPLMHTWYVCILMQFYIIIPVIFLIAKRYKENWYNIAVYILGSTCCLSLLLYLSPLLTEAQNFYLLPTRFFELGSGSLLALILSDNRKENSNVKIYIFYNCMLIAISLIFGLEIPVLKLRLVSIIAISIVLVSCSQYVRLSTPLDKILSPIIFMGTASYSMYLSHQVFFAFYRYIVNNVFTTIEYVKVLCLTIIVGIIIYYLFERPLTNYISKNKKNIYKINIVSAVLIVILSSVSFYYYRQDGMVRDIPELGLYLGQNNYTPEDYNDRNSILDKEFDSNGKKNILVIGDSFGRDWINVLRESGVDSVMNISYTMYADEHTKDRIKQADYVFVATYHPFLSSYNYDIIYPDLFNRKFWRVGLKSFGEEFIGNVYNNRMSPHYYNTKVKENKFSKEINDYERELFRDNFIDMITPIQEKDGSMKLFTRDKMLITQDGIHLTQAGAKMYAEKLNVWQYLK